MAIVVRGGGGTTVPVSKAEHDRLVAVDAAFTILRAGVEEECAPGPSRPTKGALRDLLDRATGGIP